MTRSGGDILKGMTGREQIFDEKSKRTGNPSCPPGNEKGLGKHWGIGVELTSVDKGR